MISTKAISVGFATAALIAVTAAVADAQCMPSYDKPSGAAGLKSSAVAVDGATAPNTLVVPAKCIIMVGAPEGQSGSVLAV